MANELLNQQEQAETMMVPTDGDNCAALGNMLREILSPLLSTMADFMRNNTEAVERLASSQKLQNDRLEALEKQIRLNTPVTPTQVRYFNDAIRKHARELLARKDLDGDAKAVKCLSASIRKSVVARYGIAALHEIPRHEYSVVMQQIATWNDLLILRDVMKEARKHAEPMAAAQTERPANPDGKEAF